MHPFPAQQGPHCSSEIDAWVRVFLDCTAWTCSHCELLSVLSCTAWQVSAPQGPTLPLPTCELLSVLSYASACAPGPHTASANLWRVLRASTMRCHAKFFNVRTVAVLGSTYFAWLYPCLFFTHSTALTLLPFAMQGPPLATNLRHFLSGEPLQPFVPQVCFHCLLITTRGF